MSTSSIDAKMFSQMFLAAAYNLKSNKEWINELNVFPVPDGDTGTNMTMTITSAVRELEGLGDDFDMMSLCKSISSGSLRGARGNSGVILSQLLRGFCKAVRDHAEIDVPAAAAGMDKAVETAYKAVMKPKEGTILTVAKGVAEKSRELVNAGETDVDKYLTEVIEYGDQVLASTPDMLPVLKQAGVVDSGGQGLIQVLKGALEGLHGKVLTAEEVLAEEEAPEEERQAEGEIPELSADEGLKYGYSTEFVIVLDRPANLWNPKTEKDFKHFLDSIGDTKVCEKDDNEGVVKVDLESNDPGLAIEKALMYGQLVKIKVENLRAAKKAKEEAAAGQPAPSQETPADAEQMPKKDVAFIAVCAGDGLAEIFRGLGVDYVISGGQTMNPSTEDILEAVEKVNADTVFVLPNNKNIIMAANQAAILSKDRKIIVIPTKTVPQGITAVINYMPDVDPEVNCDNMTQEIAKVKSAEVTYAVRDTVLDDVEIHQGDMMALGDSGILATGKDRDETTIDSLRKMVTPSTSLISVYYGADVTEQDAETFGDKVRSEFANCDVEVQKGGQPIYYYILSAEE